MKKQNLIIPVRIIGIKKSKLVCETETDEIILVEKPKTAKKDRYFSTIMKDLLHSGLWIPFNLKLKKILKYDWLDESTVNLDFN
ncbi:MAG: hypothetical protein ABF483_03000 [Liquorilactobacillus nagelii]|jgi:hypothetical protein|uniref:Uncharacterized protein n=2 Tax=Liquorilactobacillus nagelii TaxID=82688 RepID=A0A3Q8CGJ3_9LACO|nr:hypothetical protein [Liquorilactobacillus nagelii]AUJ32095.1 hypothetical protein BSQ50_05715 [Liquorilactobacillus nagelii]KRL41006.1 hypothetical protein FD45_GL001659 [Liquorilactobacillus nagelii DSM 13675]MCC7615255.1 hypothetical protein [Liquorilactobacillus nagelii]MCI1632597.1 hypothetical protein [Liquorilactobacillus nagelii]MCI1920712.1 hypothetical protein [Liquorilactobacillus nagelii]